MLVNAMVQPLLNLKEVAGLLNVSQKTIYYWVERNEIPFIRVGRHLRFVAPDVLSFFQRKTEDKKPTWLKYKTFAKPRAELRSLKTRDANSTPAKE